MSVSLIQAFSREQRLYKLYRGLRAFRTGFSRKNVNRSDAYHMQYLTRWIRERMLEALKSLPHAYPEDAAALIQTAKEYNDMIFEHW